MNTYSGGMKSKQVMTINVNIAPDIMVIDVVLSTGDPTFMDNCLKKMREFRERGKTIEFASHSMPLVRDFCDRAIWLEGGKLKMGYRAETLLRNMEPLSKLITPGLRKKREVPQRSSGHRS